jgi:hypothetical protein
MVDTENSTFPITNRFIPAAKLLYSVEKSYEKGKFILDEFIGDVDENDEPLTDPAGVAWIKKRINLLLF